MSGKQMDIFPWNDNFNTGTAAIDQQHKKLVKLLNNLANQAIYRPSKTELIFVFEELSNYIIYHFDCEEKEWSSQIAAHSFAQQHQQEHEQFKRRIHRLRSEIDTLSTEDIVEKTLSYLTRWLVLHILENDRFMASLLNSLKSGVNLEAAKFHADQHMRGTAKDVMGVILATYDSLSASAINLMHETRKTQRNQQQLQDSEQRLKKVLSYAKVAYWDLPYQSSTAIWSTEMFELFGLPETVIPSPETLSKIMHPDHCSIFMNSIQSCFINYHEHHVEYQVTRPSDGAIRWIECKGKLVFNADGSPNKLSGFIQDITDKKANEERIEQLAFYDPLTLLPNRRLLLDRLERSLVSSDRLRANTALLFLDIDHFKTLNDSYGHNIGDLLLSQFSQRLKACVREEDTLARIGGDEFVIVLEGLSKAVKTAAVQTENIAKSILKTFNQAYQLNDISYKSSVSIGAVLFKDQSHSCSELMQQADIAMYQAKSSGRNTLRFFDPAMQDEIASRTTLESELYLAVATDQFELYYQVQVDQQQHAIGAEALVRWNHPVKGLIQPNQFIPIAECTGLILPIGEWVLKMACRQLKAWKNDPQKQHLSIAINVSAKQFRQERFVEQVTTMINYFDINPKRLKIELTESLLLEDIDTTIEQMKTLADTGIQFSLDDFGTGYSSLQYLKQLPLHQLKIDRSFICELISEPSDQSIVQTIIAMAKNLGLNVIAEGVETEEQFLYLKSLHCQHFQGYYFSKPTPIEDFTPKY